MEENDSFVVSQTPVQPSQFESPVVSVAPVAEEPKKKMGAGKLVGVIAAVLVVLGGGIFAAVKLFGKKDEPKPEPQPVVEPTKQINADVTGDFAVRFLKMEDSGENIIYSPLSIKYGLSLLKDGASSETEAEIAQALDGAELTKYQSIPEKLSLANAVFIRDSFAGFVQEDYKAKVVADYNAEVTFDKFQSVGVLDNWVSDKTFGLIKQVGLNVTENTEMILANALAIQMDWAARFSYDNTHGGDFYLKDGTKMEATTMGKDETKIEEVGYYQDSSVTMATMDLEQMTDGTQLMFVAVMPEETSLTNYITTTDTSDILTKVAQRTTADKTKDGVTLRIPKFKFDYKLSFVDDLKALGIKTAFDEDKADFSGMANLVAMQEAHAGDNIFVSDAVHKANIDFSEEGVKAAAVTAFAMDAKSAVMMEIPDPVVIRIDHPFMFMIVDKNTQEVWFTGAVYEPNKWEDDKAQYEAQY